MIKLILGRMIEASLNNLLALNSNTQAVLTRHEGKVLELGVSDLNVTFYFIIRPLRIFVYTAYSDQATTTISATSISFLKQLQSSTTSTKLTIKGDSEFAHDFQLLLKNMDLNWEEYLSYIVGDLSAHRLANFVHHLKTTTQKITHRSKEDLIEWIQEEKKFLPTREEVEDFYEELIVLRTTLERLEARWQRLMEKSSNENI